MNPSVSRQSPGQLSYTHDFVVFSPKSSHGPVGVIVSMVSADKVLSTVSIAGARAQGLIPFTYGMTLDVDDYPDLYAVLGSMPLGSSSIVWSYTHKGTVTTHKGYYATIIGGGGGGGRLYDVIGEYDKALPKAKPKKPICECGKEKHGFASHSNWCDMAKIENVNK